ncbi:MAG TPA: ATP-grasp domain-containing protein [Burkholderiaceae bacterium]|jgi:predicted ATP-grasp superfamily ATP-dependent carboligase
MMHVFVYEHLSGGAVEAPGEELLALGRAMRDAVARDLLQLHDCAVTVAAGACAPAVPAGARAVQPAPGLAAAEFVAQQARGHDRTWVIAPETDGVLAQLQRSVEPARWIGCDAAAIALASSKRATLAQAAAHGIATPLDFAASPATRRWVVKPDDGAGAMATRVHSTRAAAQDDLEARRERGEAAVLEAWVAGEPLSVSLSCGAGGVELLSVNRQQLSVDALGVLSFAGVQVNALPADDARVPALRSWAQALMRAVPGLQGFVGFDLVWHPRRGPVLIEINPRVTMAYVGLSAALARNLAGAVLAQHCPEPARAAA